MWLHVTNFVHTTHTRARAVSTLRAMNSPRYAGRQHVDTYNNGLDERLRGSTNVLRTAGYRAGPQPCDYVLLQRNAYTHNMRAGGGHNGGDACSRSWRLDATTVDASPPRFS